MSDGYAERLNNSSLHALKQIGYAIFMAAVTYTFLMITNEGANKFREPDACLYCGGDGVIAEFKVGTAAEIPFVCPFAKTQPWLHSMIPVRGV